MSEAAEPAASGSTPHESGTRRERRQQRKRRLKDRSPVLAFFLEMATIIALAILISFIIKTFFARAFYIPSESMQPTLEVDDRIVVNLLAPGVMDIERGDVVVFEDTRAWWGEGSEAETNAVQDALVFIGLMPDTSSHYVVKRVIGTAGDTVECCDDQGRILINGEPIDEPYLYPGDQPSATEFSVTVPEDSVWLLGDHRSASADSRAHVHEEDGGAVPEEDIIGRTSAVIWPLGRIGGGGSEREPFDHVPDAQSSTQ
ncbi:signal peptidase I [Nesterenkonia flava]|uniref:Signal peptidase I n=1 Tax=Nesterenkonia flava TaxID=469799 RepID=A0ABU1FSR9_9MICC|nr:signal peptidase I [Nesterenkonia flava]MDR5711705.1 signal peptidase I [Nesterenkonia flava]